MDQVCKRLNLSRTHIWREIKAGKLKSVKIGKAIRVSEKALQQYISDLESE